MSGQNHSHIWEPKYAARNSRIQASEIRELLKLLEQPDLTSFAGGIPDPALFPVDEVRAAYQTVLADPASANKVLQYSVSEGDEGLRQWIVGYMASKNIPCNSDNILITNGSQQGLEFLGKLFLSPNDTALVRAPTYLGALQAFAAYEPRYDALQINNEKRTAQSYAVNAQIVGGQVKLAYVVPEFSNPSGETLSERNRAELLDLAQELDIAIIEDSPYAELRYDGDNVVAIQALDIQRSGSIDASRTIYCGSFSKVFTPGLRLGWICAPRQVIQRLTLIKQASDLNSSAVNQQVMLRLASKLFDGQIAAARKNYRVKRDSMLRALERTMPDGVRWSRPQGGLFIWVELPEHIDTASLLEQAVEQAKVAFVPGHAFFTDGKGKNTMRLSFSLPSVPAIESGIERLAGLIKTELL